VRRTCDRGVELNGGEGVGSLGRGETPSSGEAPGPTHGERGGVDDMAENRGERSGDGLPEADKGTGTDDMQ
jgi:hypothetical protein